MAEDIRVFDWDDEIEVDEEEEERSFVTLEPGIYNYEVTKFERGTYTPGPKAKTPACNQAIMTIRIRTDEGDCYITDRFPLASSMEWKIKQFFRSLGMRKSGDTLKMDWQGAIGRTGRVKIKKESGKNEGIYFNNVENYLDPITKEGDDDEWS